VACADSLAESMVVSRYQEIQASAIPHTFRILVNAFSFRFANSVIEPHTLLKTLEASSTADMSMFILFSVAILVTF